MKALLINCTLKPSPAKSNTEALAEVVADALRREGVEVASVRAVDRSIPPGVESDMGEGDEWPGIRAQVGVVVTGNEDGAHHVICRLRGERLGNTPAVCRSSYIDPRVLDRFRQGETIELPSLAAEGTVTPRQQSLIERRVRELIG